MHHRTNSGRYFTHASAAVLAGGHERVDDERQAQREHETGEMRYAGPETDLRKKKTIERFIRVTIQYTYCNIKVFIDL